MVAKEKQIIREEEEDEDDDADDDPDVGSPGGNAMRPKRKLNDDETLERDRRHRPVRYGQSAAHEVTVKDEEDMTSNI